MGFLRVFAVTVLLFGFAELKAEDSALGQVANQEESPSIPVPESSAAIFVGGLLWFLLLRKRA